MGRDKTKFYKKDLDEQVYDVLFAKLVPGESRHEAKLDGTAQDKIFSFGTFKTYRRQCGYFVDWIRETYPECKTLKKARKHLNEWLASLVDKDFSAWTVHTAKSAVHKLYNISGNDPNCFAAPERRRCDIKRSRIAVENDKNVTVEKWGDLMDFVRGTGTRRGVLELLTGDDLWTRERMRKEHLRLKEKLDLTVEEIRVSRALREALEVFPMYDVFVHHRRDKGGRDRFAPVLPEFAEQVIERMGAVAANDRVWEQVHATADIHSYRAEYATILYRRHARKIDEIPYDRINRGSGHRYQSDVYVCRNDAHGRKLDKRSMRLCARALGHNRIEVVASNYIRDTIEWDGYSTTETVSKK
jgi:hypothetical protein